MSAIVLAAVQGQADTIEVLIDRNADAIKLLLERGAEVNARDNQQYTALSLTGVHKFSDIVEILEKASAVEGKNIKDRTVKKYQIK
jgi:ankyrin repeat protein